MLPRATLRACQHTRAREGAFDKSMPCLFTIMSRQHAFTFLLLLLMFVLRFAA